MSHSIADYFLMFASSFFTVFLLGLQSRNVNTANYVAAVITSFGISVANFAFVKFVATGSYDVFIVCATGGCMGIASSIWFYKNLMERKNRGNSTVGY